MAERRRYTKRQKLSAVIAADLTGVVATADGSGIPESTIRYWAQQPEFAEYRARAREDMAEEVGIVAHLAWRRVAEALRAGTLEPRDALFAADKATTLYQLVTGEATTRTEQRDITAELKPEEAAKLANDIDEWLKVVAE